MSGADFEGARQYALERLERELSPALAYHSVRHTRDSVVPAAERLSHDCDIAGAELLLLRTAAWFHDIGFVEQRVGHEMVGVRIAATVLPRFGYDRAQIHTIGGLIMATRLPQAPQTLLEELMADADLDSLGRDDFAETNLLLRKELEAFGSALSDAEWYGAQLDFLRSHHYWTAAARRARDAGKRRNLLRMQAISEQLANPV